MDLQLVEQHPPRPMDDAEERMADLFYAAVQDATNQTARSIQASGHRVGVSDLGFCSERVRRSLLGQEEPLVDHTAAFFGSALGDDIEEAMMLRWPKAIRQSEVILTLRGDTGTYVLTGHPDLIDPEGILVDVKTTNGLEKVRRLGPSQQQQFQRHCYGVAAHAAGMFNPDVQIDDVMVANVWFDRTAQEPRPYVQMEPLDTSIVNLATIWLDDVVYAYQAGEAARKEPPREMCYKVCGFAPDCRGMDMSNQGGLITDTEQLTAVEMYLEASALEKRARALKKEAKETLADVAGSTGTYSVKWTKVNGASVNYERAPYEKLDIRKIR